MGWKHLVLVCIGILIQDAKCQDLTISLDFDFNNCPGKTMCNEGMDAVAADLREFIRKVSPITEKGVPWCEELVATGSYTMTRDGDVYSCPQNDADDCFIQKVDFKFDFLNFTCKCSAQQIQDQIQQLAQNPSHAGDFVKRALIKPGLLKPPAMPEAQGYILGHWISVQLVGRLKLCKKGNSKNVAEGFRIKTWNPEHMTISCTGDPALDMFCTGDYKQKIKEGIGSAVQPLMSKSVETAMMNGPADIASKFNCDYANTKV